MNNTHHTPGPWSFDLQFIVAPDPGGVHPDIYIAEIVETDDEGRIATPEQQQANLCLIAAATDLLDALEFFYNIMHDYECSMRKGYVQLALEQSRDALAKAKGGRV